MPTPSMDEEYKRKKADGSPSSSELGSVQPRGNKSVNFGLSYVCEMENDRHTSWLPTCQVFPGFTPDPPTRHRHLRHISVLSLLFLGLVTEQIALRSRVRQLVCGLLNATLWNVGLFIHVIALGNTILASSRISFSAAYPAVFCSL